jgi:hypothetical protein
VQPSPFFEVGDRGSHELGRAIRIVELPLLASALFLTSSARDLALRWLLTLPQLSLILTLVFALALSPFVFRWLGRDGPFRSACRAPISLILFERFFSDPQVTPSFLPSKNAPIVKQPDVRRRDIQVPGGLRSCYFFISAVAHMLMRYTFACVFVKRPSKC